jgi:hypothetical protein
MEPAERRDPGDRAAVRNCVTIIEASFRDRGDRATFDLGLLALEVAQDVVTSTFHECPPHRADEAARIRQEILRETTRVTELGCRVALRIGRPTASRGRRADARLADRRALRDHTGVLALLTTQWLAVVHDQPPVPLTPPTPEQVRQGERNVRLIVSGGRRHRLRQRARIRPVNPHRSRPRPRPRHRGGTHRRRSRGDDDDCDPAGPEGPIDAARRRPPVPPPHQHGRGRG